MSFNFLDGYNEITKTPNLMCIMNRKEWAIFETQFSNQGTCEYKEQYKQALSARHNLWVDSFSIKNQLLHII